MFIVKGVNVFPMSVQEALLSLRPEITGEFHIILKDAPPINYSPVIEVEVASDFPENRYTDLIDTVIAAIQQRSNFTAQINLVKQGCIATEHKTKRLYRQYLGELPPQLEILNIP